MVFNSKTYTEITWYLFEDILLRNNMIFNSKNYTEIKWYLIERLSEI